MSIIELYYFLSSREKQKCYQNSRISIFSQSIKNKKRTKTFLKNYIIFFKVERNKNVMPKHFLLILLIVIVYNTNCYSLL